MVDKEEKIWCQAAEQIVLQEIIKNMSVSLTFQMDAPSSLKIKMERALFS